MHSLSGTFVEDMPLEETSEEEIYWPLKLVLPPSKWRIMYFQNQDVQKLWLRKLSLASMQREIKDHYKFKSALIRPSKNHAARPLSLIGIHNRSGQ